MKIRVTWPWWGRPYIFACCAFAVLTNQTPNYDKIAGFVSKHVKVTLG